jgi:hypothetical protein
MWAFGNTDPRPFAPQQVWASSFGIGLILFFFTAFQGMGAHLLGANPLVNQNPQLWESMQERDAAVDPQAWAQAEGITLPQDIEEWLEVQALRDTLSNRQVIALIGDGSLEERREAGAAAVIALLGDEELNEEQQALLSNAYGAAGVDSPAALLNNQQATELYHLTLPERLAAAPDGIVPYYFNVIANSAPWLVGILAVCALAAMQSTGAAYMSTAGSMLTRDLYKRYLNPTATHNVQKFFGRLGVAFIVVAALLVATFSRDALVLLGGLAVAFGFQMWVSLAGICWIPWITRQGATWGLAAGLLAVIFTESFGLQILSAIGIEVWGRWPLTIHSAGWGMIFNVTVAVILSAMTQDEKAMAHRMTFHSFLREHASLPERKRSLIPIAWIVTIAWMIFGIGPGAVIGNTIFGAPNAPETWVFGIPSIWAWQIIFWLLGVAMMWFLAYKMEMSTMPERQIEALTEDIGDVVQKPTGAR